MRACRAASRVGCGERTGETLTWVFVAVRNRPFLFCRVLIYRRRKFSFPPERNASASLETKLEQPAFRHSSENKDTGPMPITIRARPRMGPIPAAGCDAEHINQN